MSRLILVSGAGASGKSEYAEKLAVDMHEDRLIYVATMSAYDDESRKKIEIHKKRRINTDFETIEKPYGIEEIIPFITPYDSNKKSTILIECISNLLANCPMLSAKMRLWLDARNLLFRRKSADCVLKKPADCGMMDYGVIYPFANFTCTGGSGYAHHRITTICTHIDRIHKSNRLLIRCSNCRYYR